MGLGGRTFLCPSHRGFSGHTLAVPQPHPSGTLLLAARRRWGWRPSGAKHAARPRHLCTCPHCPFPAGAQRTVPRACCGSTSLSPTVLPVPPPPTPSLCRSLCWVSADPVIKDSLYPASLQLCPVWLLLAPPCSKDSSVLLVCECPLLQSRRSSGQTVHPRPPSVSQSPCQGPQALPLGPPAGLPCPQSGGSENCPVPANSLCAHSPSPGKPHSLAPLPPTCTLFSLLTDLVPSLLVCPEGRSSPGLREGALLSLTCCHLPSEGCLSGYRQGTLMFLRVGGLACGGPCC